MSWLIAADYLNLWSRQLIKSFYDIKQYLKDNTSVSSHSLGLKINMF